MFDCLGQSTAYFPYRKSTPCININVDYEIQGTTADYGEINEGMTVAGFALSELHIDGASVASLAVIESRFAGAADNDIGITVCFLGTNGRVAAFSARSLFCAKQVAFELIPWASLRQTTGQC